MFGYLTGWLLDPPELTPHGFCLLWRPGLVWTYAISDTGIVVAYLTIPLALIVFAHRRDDFVFRPVFSLFASFILLCGTTHVLDVLTLWMPAYGLEGVTKVATATVSIVTAITVWLILPTALALPSPTQLRQANVALRESESRYRASFYQSPVPMQTLNEQGIVVAVSRSWQTLFGYTEDQVIGRHVTDLQAGAPLDWAAEDRTALMAQGEVHDLERCYVRGDGSQVDVLLSARTEQRGDAASIVCVLIDVTERRKTEAALRASEERLHQVQKMEAVGQRTGGIAHDFNNMLQTIMGALDIMERRLDAGRVSDIQRYIAMAKKAADNAATLTNRMLAFARRQTLQPTMIAPHILLREMTDLVRSGLGPADRLELGLHEGWSILCDASQLQNALLNLVFNARDAMPEGGTLRLSNADRTMSRVDLADETDVQPGDYVEIAVADSGSGMSPDVLRRAFEPFFTTRPFGHGTGLGLSQVYGFVRQSAGFVRLESAPGQGTTVRLYLPRRFPPEACASGYGGARETQDDTTVAETTTTVLVVEDEEGVRETIVAVLSEHGYVMIEAEDGPSALRIIQSPVRIDLLLTDVGLPGLNGRQLADAARVSRPDLPVLLITGYAGSALDTIELGSGMRVLRKPFELETLSDQVRAMLRARSSSHC